MYSLRALFEKNILLAYQMSSDVWSPTGDPCVSLGHSCTHLKHVQAFPWSHQWDVCSHCLLRCSVSGAAFHSRAAAAAGGSQAGCTRCVSSWNRCGALGVAPLLPAARDTQQKADSPGWLVHTYLQPLVLWIFLPCFPNRVQEQFGGKRASSRIFKM